MECMKCIRMSISLIFHKLYMEYTIIGYFRTEFPGFSVLFSHNETTVRAYTLHYLHIFLNIYHFLLSKDFMSSGLDNFHSSYVYRVLRPDEDENEDLTCKDASSKRSLAIHVETGLWTPSKYISTAGSLEKAKKWLETANEQTSQIFGNTRTTIVRIDVAKIKSYYPEIANSAIDLTREINRNCFLENDLQRNYARAYKEVVFVEYIPSEVITVEYKTDEIRDENHQLPIQSNDSFHNTNRSDDLSHESMDSVHSEAHTKKKRKKKKKKKKKEAPIPPTDDTTDMSESNLKWFGLAVVIGALVIVKFCKFLNVYFSMF